MKQTQLTSRREFLKTSSTAVAGALGHYSRKPDTTELAHQIQNYSNYSWLNGTFFVDWLIHNIDVCCWAKNAWPTSAHGMGGRARQSGRRRQLSHRHAGPDQSPVNPLRL